MHQAFIISHPIPGPGIGPGSGADSLQIYTASLQLHTASLQTKPDRVKTKPDKVKVKPDKVKTKPDRVQTYTASLQLHTAFLQTKPDRVKVKPDRVKTKPDRVQTKLCLLQTYTALLQTRNDDIHIFKFKIYNLSFKILLQTRSLGIMPMSLLYKLLIIFVPINNCTAMLRKLFCIVFVFTSLLSFGQGVGINNNGLPATPSALLDVSDTTRGVLVPRMTNAQRNNIVNPANGLLIFNTNTYCFNFFRNGNWYELCGNCIGPSTPTAGSNSPICAGNTLNLTATTIPNATYSWSGPQGFTSTAQNPVIANAQASQSGTYSVTATINGCMSAAGTVTVTVNSVPSATFTFTPSSPNIGAQVTFTPTLSGATYSWTFASGTPATSTAQNPVVTWASAGTYAVGLTVTSGGCSASSSSNIVVSSAPVNVRAFITSTKYDGNLGGLTGADAKCQARAVAAGLTGTWKAWLSDGSTSAASRLTHPTGQITTVNGIVIANDWASLLALVVHNLNYNEFGAFVGPESGGSAHSCSWAGGYFLFAWTNTSTASGTVGNIWGTNHCNNWSSNSSGLFGATDYIYNVTSNFTYNFGETCWDCYMMNRLECFEQ